LANGLALTGWILLISGLLLQNQRNLNKKMTQAASLVLLLGGRVIPVVLSLGYAAAIATWWGSATGGFDSLQGVASLFQSPGILLAGWVHYLAFDLWLGRWQIDALAAQDEISWLVRLLVVPCLLATFMFGPVGLLLFLLLMRVRAITANSVTASV
jgi:hypothetical protein